MVKNLEFKVKKTLPNAINSLLKFIGLNGSKDFEVGTFPEKKSKINRCYLFLSILYILELDTMSKYGKPIIIATNKVMSSMLEL